MRYRLYATSGIDMCFDLLVELKQYISLTYRRELNKKRGLDEFIQYGVLFFFNEIDIENYIFCVDTQDKKELSKTLNTMLRYYDIDKNIHLINKAICGIRIYNIKSILQNV